MSAPRLYGPHFITCQYAPCGKRKQVRRPSDVRRQRFCCYRCSNLAKLVQFTCERPGCGRTKRMRPSIARVRRFCSRRCSSIATADRFSTPFTRATLEQRRAWWLKGQATRKQKTEAKLERLTKKQCVNLGYGMGYKAGVRYMQRCAR